MHASFLSARVRDCWTIASHHAALEHPRKLAHECARNTQVRRPRQQLPMISPLPRQLTLDIYYIYFYRHNITLLCGNMFTNCMIKVLIKIFNLYVYRDNSAIVTTNVSYYHIFTYQIICRQSIRNKIVINITALVILIISQPRDGAALILLRTQVTMGNLHDFR
jgi:hypothetical protein